MSCPVCQNTDAKEHPKIKSYVQCGNFKCQASVPKEHFYSLEVKARNLKPEEVCDNCGRNEKAEDNNYCTFCLIPKSPYLKESKKDAPKPTLIGKIRI